MQLLGAQPAAGEPIDQPRDGNGHERHGITIEIAVIQSAGLGNVGYLDRIEIDRVVVAEHEGQDPKRRRRRQHHHYREQQQCLEISADRDPPLGEAQRDDHEQTGDGEDRQRLAQRHRILDQVESERVEVDVIRRLQLECAKIRIREVLRDAHDVRPEMLDAVRIDVFRRIVGRVVPGELVYVRDVVAAHAGPPELGEIAAER